jgi:endonuclease-3
MTSQATTKIDQVYAVLLDTYGHHPLKPREDPLRQLIMTILSHRTTYRDERRAYDAMRRHFGSWEGIRDAPTDVLIDVLSPVRFPERKGPYIQGTLKRIIEERGEASIDFLAEWTTDDALSWLMSLPGVGVKTATLVLLFSFHKPVMPVDTHLHRVSGRLGIIAPKTSAEAAHGVLLKLLGPEPQRLYNYHRTMFTHGQRICTWNHPKCSRCPLAHLCDYYQSTTDQQPSN